MTDNEMTLVTLEVRNELKRQERLKLSGRFKHTCADPEMSDLYALAVLTEELGEVARALQEADGNLREELIQVAAVASAWAIKLERQ